MILDLDRFLAAERPFWRELETLLIDLERGGQRHSRQPPASRLEHLRRLHYLYQRTCADLAKVQTFAAAPELRPYLENLVARAYGEVHEVRAPERWNPWHFFIGTFPRAVRRQARAGALALAVTLAGALFGATALILDPGAKTGLIPFPHLSGNPAQRVAAEEASSGARSDANASFSSQLMTHNFRVSVLAMALGMSWGLGTVVLLFTNGVLLGAVTADYFGAGQGRFLLGWLLPHGAIEIPAIVIAGQAGLVLAGALLGWADQTPLRARLRRVAPDLVALIGGVALMLVWAGLVEAFLSQVHEPVLPYSFKIAFGTLELAVLGVLLTRAGRAAVLSAPPRPASFSDQPAARVAPPGPGVAP